MTRLSIEWQNKSGTNAWVEVRRWTKHGLDRLYITDYKGKPQGYYDLQNGCFAGKDFTWTSEAYRDAIQKAVLEYVKNMEDVENAVDLAEREVENVRNR